MGQEPDARYDIRDFPGLVLRMDMRDLPPGGAVMQINVSSQYPGRLVTRQGYRKLHFDEDNG